MNALHRMLLLGLMVSALLPSCQEDEPKQHVPYEQPKHIVESPYNDYVHIRSLGSPAEIEARYLGRSFNLASYVPNDMLGFTIYDVIDTKLIDQNKPWSPFGRPVEEDLLPPEVVEREGYTEPRLETITSRTRQSILDSLSFSLGAGYGAVKLGYSEGLYSLADRQSLHYHSLYGYRSRYVLWNLGKPTDLEFYLSKRFVRDLRQMTARDLVAKYGTHVVQSYSFGAFQQLDIAASAEFFTHEDMTDIHASLWSGKGNFSRKSLTKAASYRHQLAVVYLQAGSEYVPPRPFFSPGTLLSDPTDIEPLDQAGFIAKVRKDRPSFFGLEGPNVAIPDLISDRALKVKYLCGILDRAQLNPRRPWYVLSTPDYTEAVKKDGWYLMISLAHYESFPGVYIYVGDDPLETVNDPLGKYPNTRWEARLGEDGRWTFVSLGTDRYLCRDLKVRTQAEDTTDLRFWALNPAIPREGVSYESLRTLLYPYH